MVRKRNVMLIGLVVLLVTCCTAYAGDAKVKWGAVSGDVTGYKVCYGTSPGSYPNEVDVGNVTEYALSNLSLEAGETYYFVVRAYNQYCESSDSDYIPYTPGEASGGIPNESEPVFSDGSSTVDATPPLNPQGVTAQLLDGNLYVRWQAVVAEDLAGYRVYYGVASRNYGPSIPVGNVTQYKVDNVENGTTYYFAVTAVDTSYNESGFSPETSITMPAAVVVDNPPSIMIAAPVATGTYETTNGSVVMSGTAKDDNGVSQVKWSSSRGGNGTATGTATWSIGSIPLYEGTNVLSVTAYDTTGQSTGKSIDVIYHIPDTEKPVVVISSPTVTGDSGFSTSLTSINLAGTASDNKDISKVTWTNAATGVSGTATGTANWSAANIGLKAGSNIITISAYDAAQNKGAATISVTYNVPDIESPKVTLATPTTGTAYATAASTLSMAGASSDNKGVTKVTWANAATGVTGTASGTTSWSATNISLKPGVNTVTITAFDMAGNQGSIACQVTYNEPDTVKPTIYVVSPTTADTYSTVQPFVLISGKAQDNKDVSKVTWSNAATNASGIAQGTYSWATGSVALAPGKNAITIAATDSAGNKGTITVNVTYNDVQAPAIALQSPVTGTSYSTDSSQISLSGIAADNVGVTRVTWTNASGGSGLASGTTRWTVGGIALREGLNEIVVTAYDAAGNYSSHSLGVVYTPLDTEKPVIHLVSPTTTSYSTTASTISLSGTTTDNVGVTQVTWANSDGNSGIANGTSSWNVNTINLQVGSNTIVVGAVDAAGNKSTLSLMVDYRPPVSSAVDAPSDSSTQTDAVITDAPTDTQTDISGSDTSKSQSDKPKKDSFKSRFLRFFNIGL